MPRKVKEELTVVYADEDVEAAVSAEAETATLSEAGQQSCLAEGVGSSIPEIPWQEVIPKRRGGRQKSEQTVDLKAKTRCEGCGRQMCFHTLKLRRMSGSPKNRRGSAMRRQRRRRLTRRP